jgi:hypothetical protein
MLRSGLILLGVSSVGVILRTFEYMAPTPMSKWACSVGLLAAISCFMASYCLTEFVHSKNNH